MEPRSPKLWADSLPGEPQGKPRNSGVGNLTLLQWTFLTQELNWGLLHCRQILYQLSHKGSPGIVEWVAYPFFRGSSLPRNRTRVSRNGGRLFTNRATREAHLSLNLTPNLFVTKKKKKKKENKDKGKTENQKLPSLNQLLK